MHRTRTMAMALLTVVALGCERTVPSAVDASTAERDIAQLVAPFAVLDPLEAFDGAALTEAAHGARPAAVTGSGHYTVAGELRTFSFHAIVKKDGTVDGKFELHNRATGARLHGRVSCVAIFANNAWFGGVVENANVPLGEAIWRVRDNGEGADAPDQISGMIIVPNRPGTAARQCLTRGLQPLNVVEKGNVQIHPTADLSGPFTGMWSGVRLTPDGRTCCTFRWELQQTGTEVTGFLLAPHSGCLNMGGCPLTGTVTGNVLEFEVKLTFAGVGVTNRGTATLDGDVITGTVGDCFFDTCRFVVPFRVTRQ